MGVETRRAAAGSRHKKTTPPIMSHDFVIQNHGDIMSCVLMIFIIGLMFPLFSPISALFIAPQYNETVNSTTADGVVNAFSVYTNGTKDIFTVFFYTVAWIVVHAVIQEYAIDKLQRKTHLSKTKTSKFAESGHYIAFSLYSIIHGVYVILEFMSHFTDFRNIWTGYPDEHKWMSLNMKMFFILQIAYWFHQFPEFYFQRYKKEDIKQRVPVILTYIFFIAGAYITNFVRISVILLVLEYTSQFVFHIARLAFYSEKKFISQPVFKLSNVIFVIVRCASAVGGVLTFWYGLRQSEAAYVDVSNGNFNTATIRLNSLLFVLALQIVQFWGFLTYHVGKYREASNNKKKSEKRSAAPPKPVKKPQTDESETESTPLDKKKKN